MIAIEILLNLLALWVNYLMDKDFGPLGAVAVCLLAIGLKVRNSTCILVAIGLLCLLMTQGPRT
ncbi:hypothetical protein ABZ871_27230 [Streptomyces populi]